MVLPPLLPAVERRADLCLLQHEQPRIFWWWDMSRPRRESPDRVSRALRLDRGLHERVLAAAEEREVSVNWLISRLIEEGMDRLVPASELVLTRPPSGGGT